MGYTRVQGDSSRVCADGIVAGCPKHFDLLRSSPFPNTNTFLYGSSAAVLNAHQTEVQPVHSQFSLAARVPSLWYACLQRYMPYSETPGLDGPAVARETAERVLDAQEPSGADDDEGVSLRERVWGMVRGIYGDQKWFSLRFGAWFLKHIFTWLYNGELYVDPASTDRLRELQPTSTFLYVPTHKSHLDYHMLSFILFSQSLPCPHIAAGDNLNLPLVGRIMRSCGAFFIRRAVKGAPDSALYKATLEEYVHTLLRHGCATEFFIEGGRTRDGTVSVPKLGLLAACVDASLDEPSAKPLRFVPVTITYDLPLEERGLLRELLGVKKEKETLVQFLGVFGRLLLRLAGFLVWPPARPLGCGGTNGRVAVAFGEPVGVQKFCKDHGKGQKRRPSSKRSKVTPSPSGENFDDLIAEFVALDNAAAEIDPRTAATANGFPAPPPMPAGSEARRNAVAALGSRIHTMQLRANVIPSSALLATALLPGHFFAEPRATPRSGHGAATSSAAAAFNAAGSSSGPGAASAALQLAALVPLATLEARYRWLQTQIAARGHTCMQLPSAPVRASDRARFLTEIAGACSAYVDTARPTPQRAGGGPADAQPRFAVRADPIAGMWQYARLNYLMPAFAAEGLVVCAMLAAVHSGDGGGGSPRRLLGSPGDSRPASVGPSGEPSLDVLCRGGVNVVDVRDQVQWLRRLLQADLDAALGVDGVSSPHQVTALLDRMLQSGALVSDVGDECDPPAVSASRSEGKALTFAAALLSPLLATYAAVLTHAADILLLESPLPRSQLAERVLAAMQAAADASATGTAFASHAVTPGVTAAPPGPLLSCLVVGNALQGWTAAGALVSVGGRPTTLEPSTSLIVVDAVDSPASAPDFGSSYSLAASASQANLTKRASKAAARAPPALPADRLHLAPDSAALRTSLLARLQQCAWRV